MADRPLSFSARILRALRDERKPYRSAAMLEGAAIALGLAALAYGVLWQMGAER